MTWENVTDKFRRLTVSVMRPQGVQPVIDAVRSTEQVGASVFGQRMLAGMRNCVTLGVPSEWYVYPGVTRLVRTIGDGVSASRKTLNGVGIARAM